MNTLRHHRFALCVLATGALLLAACGRPGVAPGPAPAPAPAPAGTASIMGASSLSGAQLAQWFRSRQPQPSGLFSATVSLNLARSAVDADRI